MCSHVESLHPHPHVNLKHSLISSATEIMRSERSIITNALSEQKGQPAASQSLLPPCSQEGEVKVNELIWFSCRSFLMSVDNDFRVGLVRLTHALRNMLRA